MADPRITPPGRRQANHSELMQRLSKASAGEVVNMCPFGCEDHELDSNGYCRHLVGFTNDGRNLEPMRRRAGRRVVRVHRERYEVGEDDDGRPEYEEGPPQYERVLPGDELVRITVSHRVYRDVKPVPQQDPKAVTPAGAKP